MKTVLILEDNDERIAGFKRALASIAGGYELRVWRDAHSMRRECEACFPNAALISLDHDLNPAPGVTADPGTGLDVAKFLAEHRPVCPVIIHSTNADRSWSMHNELRFAEWIVDKVGPIGSDWIEKLWLPKARELLAGATNTWVARLPSDHDARMERMLLSLDGLSIGDALGEMLCYRSESAPAFFHQNELPAGPWFHTDDTEMAISVAAVLKSYGFIDQDALSRRFASRFERDPDRGYGKMTRIQLREIMAGARWRATAANAFGGQGSMGNGGAMRVAPLGAYFAEDLREVAEQARLSSEVTHTHPEGIAGTVAVAVAAALAWRLRSNAARAADKSSSCNNQPERAAEFLNEVYRATPESEVRKRLVLASQIPFQADTRAVAQVVGCGELVTAPDTVPFCIWAAARHLDNYPDALAQTIRVGGDCDTNAAIVGGVVSLSVSREGIPADWLIARESLNI